MLKGIDPLLNGELLKVLDEMGHGDQLLVVDRNYPAAASGRPVIRVADASVERVLAAVMSVFPLDRFVPLPVERMEVNGDPTLTTDLQDRVLGLLAEADGWVGGYGVVAREDFYWRAQGSFAVLHTLETAPYSCFILTKGVVFPPGIPDDGS